MGFGELETMRRLVPRSPAGVLDGVVAGALLVGALWAVGSLPDDTAVPVTVLGAVLCTTSVGWRRVAPASAAVVALVGVLLYQLAGHDTQGAFVSVSVVLTSYMVGRAPVSRDRRALVATAALAAVVAIQITIGFSFGNVVATWVPLVIAPMVAGWFVRDRAATVDALGKAREQLRHELVRAESRAVTDERTRVARELHDAVAHAVSVMVIQAGAARLMVSTEPVAARNALGSVADSGREALADVRRMVGIRRRGADDPTSPCPGLDQLTSLVDRTRRAGIAVNLRLEVTTGVPGDMDLAIYRIVQEALNNVALHAPTARVQVRVSVTGDTTEIAVEDSGPAAPTPTGGSGHGLPGMRERAALLGGELRAGPSGQGGFAVRASWPMNADRATAAKPGDSDPQPSGRRRWPAARTVDLITSMAWFVALEVEAVTSTHRDGPLLLTAAAVARKGRAGVLRRRWPLAFVAVVSGCAIALSGGIGAPQRPSVTGAYTVLMCAYAVAVYCPLPRAVVGLGGFLGGLIVANSLHHTGAGVAFGGALMSTAVWIVGRVVRDKRARADDLRATNGALIAEREIRTEVALHEERLRIAADLQAITATFISTMVVQAESAERLLETDGDGAAAAIGAVEQTGREALAHLRRMLGVLRRPDEPAPRRPQLESVA